MSTHHPNQQQRQPEQKLFPVKILRGYWPLDGGKKIPVGSEVKLPIDEAKGLIRSGIAERADPIE